MKYDLNKLKIEFLKYDGYEISSFLKEKGLEKKINQKYFKGWNKEKQEMINEAIESRFRKQLEKDSELLEMDFRLLFQIKRKLLLKLLDKIDNDLNISDIQKGLSILRDEYVDGTMKEILRTQCRNLSDEDKSILIEIGKELGRKEVRNGVINEEDLIDD